MNPQIQRLRSDIAADRGALARHLSVLERVPLTDLADEADLALVAWSLHHAYCAIEAVLERVARVLEGGVPAGADWHRELVSGAFREIINVRPCIFRATNAVQLHDLRGFRHVVRHAYDFELEVAPLQRLRAITLELRDQLAADLDEFDRWLGAAAGV